MGQVQSEAVDQTEREQPSSSSSSSSSSLHDSDSQPATSMESLLAEAAAYGDDENESLDAKARKALDCPCIADLRNGPCGDQFSVAFLCFLKSTSEEKGSECVHPFVALQNCIKSNPDAFSKDILEEEEEEEEDKVKKNEEEQPQEYRIAPPSWSREPQSPTSKL